MADTPSALLGLEILRKPRVRRPSARMNHTSAHALSIRHPPDSASGRPPLHRPAPLIPEPAPRVPLAWAATAHRPSAAPIPRPKDRPARPAALRAGARARRRTHRAGAYAPPDASRRDAVILP